MAKNKSSARAPGSRILCGVMAMLLALFLAAGTVLSLLYLQFLSPSSFTRSFSATGYYAAVRQYAHQSAAYALTPTGLPDSVLEDVFTLPTVRAIADASVNGMGLEGYNAGLSELGDTLRANIYSYMEREGIPQSSVDPAEIEEIIETVQTNFAAVASFPYASQVSRLSSLYQRLLLVAVVVLVVLCAVCGFVIWRRSGWAHRALRYLSYAFGGAGLMLCVLPLVLFIGGWHKRMGLEPEYFYNFFVHHVDTLLLSLLIAAVVCLIGYVVCAIVAERKRRGEKRKRHRQAHSSPAGL